MSNLVEIPTHAALSITSGKVIPSPNGEENGASDLQKAFEELTGSPVFTHMLAHRGFVDFVADHIRKHTSLNSVPDPEPSSTGGWIELSKKLHEEHGPTISIPRINQWASPDDILHQAFCEPLHPVKE